MSLMLASLAMQGVGMGLSALQQKKQRELQEKMAQQAIPTTTAVGSVGMKYGGNLREYMTGGKLKSYGKGGKYVGNSHEEGGIPVDESGVPTDRNNAVAEVEGGETVQDQMIFSDSILVPGTDMTFAQAHEKLMQENGTDEEVAELFQMQESLKAENAPAASNAEGEEMQQMPNEQMGEEVPEMFDGGLLAQRLAPSVMQLGMAALVDRPKKIKPNLVTPEKEQVDRSLYNQQRSDIATSARTAVDGGGRADIVHAQTLKGMSGATANQNQRQVDVDNRNVQTANRAKEVNAQAKQQAQLQNLQRKEQDTAARINLVTQAITQPLNAYAQDDATMKQNMANITIAAAKIPDAKDREEYINNAANTLGVTPKQLRARMRANNNTEESVEEPVAPIVEEPEPVFSTSESVRNMVENIRNPVESTLQEQEVPNVSAPTTNRQDRQIRRQTQRAQRIGDRNQLRNSINNFPVTTPQEVNSVSPHNAIISIQAANRQATSQARIEDRQRRVRNLGESNIISDNARVEAPVNVVPSSAFRDRSLQSRITEPRLPSTQPQLKSPKDVPVYNLNLEEALKKKLQKEIPGKSWEALKKAPSGELASIASRLKIPLKELTKALNNTGY